MAACTDADLRGKTWSYSSKPIEGGSDADAVPGVVWIDLFKGVGEVSQTFTGSRVHAGYVISAGPDSRTAVDVVDQAYRLVRFAVD